MGALFGKTLSLSEEIHNAMISRGFDGEMHTLTRHRWCWRDTLWLLSLLLLTLLTLMVEQPNIIHFSKLHNILYIVIGKRL